MALTLVMIRCPDEVPPERREVHGGEFTIGRGDDNQWVIPDPDRHLSKRHCRIVYTLGDWELYDLSTNGTFLNQANDPLGRGVAQKLHNGDRIKFGPYELEVRIEEVDADPRSARSDFLSDRPQNDFARDPPPRSGSAFGDPDRPQNDFMRDPPARSGSPFGDSDRLQDEFLRDPPARSGGSFGDSDRPQSEYMRDPAPRSGSAFSDVGLPDVTTGMGGSRSPMLPPDFDPLAPNPEPFQGTQADHSPALQSAFRPPTPTAIIPDDWDVDLLGGSQPQAPSPPPPPAPPPQAPVAPAPAPAPQAPRSAQEAARPARAPAELRPAPAPVDAASDGALATAFLKGVGLGEATLSEPEKMMLRVGAAMRATVSGLRQTLMARAKIKDEFRIAQTVIRASGNNPLKFSLDDDDALATLLGTGRRGGMSPDTAIAEAFNDLRLHELATVAAMQSAVRVLLEQFAPEAVERKAGSNGGLQIHPAQKKAKAWDAFVRQHKSITQALSDDFDSVFGKAFARAYEQAIDELTGEGNERKSS